ncbi:MAG: hypothetical protein WCK01_04965 [Candidatus Uhrbacteria bacterium]
MIERAMHPVQKRGIWGLVAMFALLVPIYLVLPLSQGPFLASPDETANAEVIRQLAWYGRVAAPESLAVEFPWMHPRSFATHGANIVPVGFIGWPWVLSVFSLILGLWIAPVLAALFGLSMAYPLFRLLESEFGYKNAWLATLIAMTVPGMIVFGNRALFPQVGVLGFFLWSLWLLRRLKTESRTWPFVVVGLLISFTCASRPTEMLWTLPWLAWAGWSLRPTQKQAIAALISFMIPILAIGVFAQIAYGGFWKSGYTMRDNVVATNLVGAIHELPLQAASGSILFPFGIHPTHVAWNVLHYGFIMQWPWMIVLFIAVGFVLRHAYISRSKFVASQYVVPLLAAWTGFALVAYYGHGLYSDNINGGSTTIANSFIRYLLPMSPVIGLAAAYLFRRIGKVAIPATIVLVLFGGWMAFARDAEGILNTRAELMRYSSVREAAKTTFHPMDVILSERSDKIFFPAFRAVSPLPLPEQVAELSRAHAEIQIGLYVRPLAQAQADAWRTAGFEPIELGYFGREKLYLLRPIKR